MRVLVAACGSRGDFQPMLALALALRRNGHEPLLAGTPTFASEAAFFGLPFAPAGLDSQRLLAEHRERVNPRNPLQFIRLLNSVLLDELRAQAEGFTSRARGVDLVVAGGAVLAAKSVAEAAGVPYRYVAYTPQVLPSAHHAPFMLPLTRAPRWVNRLSWATIRAFYNRLSRASLNELRHRLGLGPVPSAIDHLFSPAEALVAADAEVAPLPPDVSVPQVGSFCLADERPLPADVEHFLAAGEPPIYLGFGSMPDARPEQTTRLLAEAVRRAGVRALLSSGWAGLGAEALGPELLVVGPLSHWRLFPRLGAVVHHGGAGTTAAAARAGVPQLVVPHAFDQFMMGHYVQRARLGTSLPRGRLSVERLARALVRLSEDAALRANAAQVGDRIRARDALDAAVTLLTRDATGCGALRATPARVG